jgi:hypothetical protein
VKAAKNVIGLCVSVFAKDRYWYSGLSDIFGLAGQPIELRN